MLVALFPQEEVCFDQNVLLKGYFEVNISFFSLVLPCKYHVTLYCILKLCVSEIGRASFYSR